MKTGMAPNGLATVAWSTGNRRLDEARRISRQEGRAVVRLWLRRLEAVGAVERAAGQRNERSARARGGASVFATVSAAPL